MPGTSLKSAAAAAKSAGRRGLEIQNACMTCGLRNRQMMHEGRKTRKSTWAPHHGRCARTRTTVCAARGRAAENADETAALHPIDTTPHETHVVPPVTGAAADVTTPPHETHVAPADTGAATRGASGAGPTGRNMVEFNSRVERREIGRISSSIVYFDRRIQLKGAPR